MYIRRQPLLLENGRGPYDVYAGSYLILAVCRSLASGCTRWCLARNRAFGPTRWCWGRTSDIGLERSALVVHTGVGLKMSVFGCICW
ncbi:uncharacterized protein LACBIDRAFT_314371 [Laccaria bicolor S238N-H82]|uniref:Predicted protein n=1 Tax=Laccaria bicolor (strain S238N-H82 / ATCC MYA-4686) TaxID=486041 RepID=B0DYE5_LACBS|nr:uncharacterized protein LACBIDRAFT_314371 [Laccaria bicolor S238N-H82]EDR00376.1 predicted protein [Laccaria bicolor S238N-H82]|eukprot:XP_001888935.1 predicted protein [Laccaria bicolor S238N-H82]